MSQDEIVRSLRSIFRTDDIDAVVRIFESRGQSHGVDHDAVDRVLAKYSQVSQVDKNLLLNYAGFLTR